MRVMVLIKWQQEARWSGRLAARQELQTLTKLSTLPSSPLSKSAKKSHDFICNTKAKHGQTFENFVQRSVHLIYTAALLFFSVSCCEINQLTDTQENAIPPIQPLTLNAWSQLTSYTAILQDGRATAPYERTNIARDKASRSYRKLHA